MTPKLVLASILAAIALAGLTACSSHSGAKAKASAAASSTTGQTAVRDAKALFGHCLPANQLSPVAWKTAMQCGGVPKGQRLAAAQCALTAIEHGGKMPAGKQARETAILNDAYPCVQKYQRKGTG